MMRIAMLATTLIAMVSAIPAKSMTLTSQDVREGARVPQEHVYGACNGNNVSPALSWSGAPAATKSFAITMFDPDAPRQGGWWHWIAFGIPPASHALARDAGKADGSGMPKGALQATNDYGEVGYGGPCPPPGHKPHRYEFTIWALDSAKLPFGPEATGGAILTWLQSHVLGKAMLTAKYGR